MHAKNLPDRWLNLDRVQRRNGAHFSVTVKMDPKVRHAIGGIAEDAWTAINYPSAIYDEASDT